MAMRYGVLCTVPQILWLAHHTNSQTKQLIYRHELWNAVTDAQSADLGRQPFTNARLRDADCRQILQQTSQTAAQSPSYSPTISNRYPTSSLSSSSSSLFTGSTATHFHMSLGSIYVPLTCAHFMLLALTGPQTGQCHCIQVSRLQFRKYCYTLMENQPLHDVPDGATPSQFKQNRRCRCQCFM